MEDYIVADVTQANRESYHLHVPRTIYLSRLPPCPGAEAEDDITNSNCHMAHTKDNEQPPDKSNGLINDSPSIFLYPSKRIWPWGEAWG
jgi:hypothetical protein